MAAPRRCIYDRGALLHFGSMRSFSPFGRSEGSEDEWMNQSRLFFFQRGPVILRKIPRPILVQYDEKTDNKTDLIEWLIFWINHKPATAKSRKMHHPRILVNPLWTGKNCFSSHSHFARNYFSFDIFVRYRIGLILCRSFTKMYSSSLKKKPNKNLQIWIMDHFRRADSCVHATVYVYAAVMANSNKKPQTRVAAQVEAALLMPDKSRYTELSFTVWRR